MQGINRKQYGHIVDALLRMERLLSDRQKECTTLKQAEDYKRDLESMYINYERLLKELSEQITAYEILYSEVKVQFLSKKLKEMKKEIPPEKPAFVMLQTSIKLVLGT